MRNAWYEIYDTVDELREEYPMTAERITDKFPKYNGAVYVFEVLEEFAKYELTEGDFWDVIDFNMPYTKLIDMENVINWYTLGDNIRNVGLKGVIDCGDITCVLADMKL